MPTARTIKQMLNYLDSRQETSRESIGGFLNQGISLILLISLDKNDRSSSR